MFAGPSAPRRRPLRASATLLGLLWHPCVSTPGGAQTPPRRIELTEDSVPSLGSDTTPTTTGAPAGRRWFDNVEVWGYTAVSYLDTGDTGWRPHGSFFLRDAALFVRADATPEVRFAQSGRGETRRVRFARTGLVQIHCNIHPKMSAAIVVLQNPYFAVTDSDGWYTVTGIPPGTHSLRVWHQLGGEATKAVRCETDHDARHDFTVHETKKLVAHRNKFGKRYRDKY